MVIQTVLDHPPRVFLLEHPENLGSVSSRPSPTVRPASIWELEEVRSLCQSGVFTVAFYQCQFGARSRKPTRLLSNIPALRAIGYNQWPRLDKLGRYVGPLPPHCSCGFSHQGIIKRSASDAFATTQAAAYPEQMDLALAWALWDFLVSPSAPSSSPLGGVPALQKEQQCQIPAPQEEKVPEAEEQEEKRSAENPGIPREESREVRKEEIEELIEGARKKAEEELAKASAVPPLGSAPLKVYYKGKVRNMVDGLGKCSLGVRPAGSRVKSLSRNGAALARGFWRHVEKLPEAMGEKERRRLLSRLALGQVEESPFKGVIEKVRKDLDELVVRLGKDPTRRPTDRATAVGFRRAKAWAELLGDEDHQFLEGLVRRGVPLGVRGEIPLVPAVYDRKEKGEQEPPRDVWEEEAEPSEPRTNYRSAMDHLEKVKSIIQAEIEKGWIRRLPLEEAYQKFGRDVQIASLGAVPKDPSWEEVRVVHDGTHGLSVNSEIKQPNRMTFPQCDDLEAAAEALKRVGPTERMLFAFDIKAAHRLIPVQEEDWALQSFRLEDEKELLVNMVGTFGVASAAFWWGRAAAVIFRTFHRSVPGHLLYYLLLFADDGLLMTAGPEYFKVVVALFLYLDVMEVPLSWRKTRGGFQAEWIGYTIDLRSWKVGVSEKKVRWLVEWAERTLKESHLLGREFRAGVGRLGFLAGVLVGARPLLAPLYAVASRVGGSSYVELHLAVKIAIQFFADWVRAEPVRELRAPPRVAGEVFRIDAAADQDGISIGGWEVYGGKRPEEARWFSVKVTRKVCAWLYLKGEPFRTIAAAELLAVTVAVVVFGKEAGWRGADGRFTISGFTDNSSNTFVVDKFLTTKFPVSLVLMELAYQLASLKANLSLQWIPREQNEEADDLSKERFDRFDPAKRIEVDLEEMGFKVIPRLAEVAGQLDEEIRMKKTSKKEGGATQKTPAEEKLRMTQPW